MDTECVCGETKNAIQCDCGTGHVWCADTCFIVHNYIVNKIKTKPNVSYEEIIAFDQATTLFGYNKPSGLFALANICNVLGDTEYAIQFGEMALKILKPTPIPNAFIAAFINDKE